MNRTQKGARFTLGISILIFAFGAIVLRSMFAPGGGAAGVGLVRVWIWLILVFMAGGVAVVHWKRRPSEVDHDERDQSIRKNAVLVSFVSLWLLLIAASIIPSFVAGDTGSIPVCLLPIINMGVFLLVMLVHSVSVLAQYEWTTKENNHE